MNLPTGAKKGCGRVKLRGAARAWTGRNSCTAGCGTIPRLHESAVERMWRRKLQALRGEANGLLPPSSNLTSVYAVGAQGELLAASGGWY